MSFAGSTLLTGVGALMYKYDRHQSFQLHPDLLASRNHSLMEVYKLHLRCARVKYAKLLVNFFPGLLQSNSAVLPIKGVADMSSNLKEYSMTVLTVLSVYLLAFTLVSMVYWATITPVYTAAFAIFGPPGLLVAWTHSILQANILTMMFMRLSHLQNSLVAKSAAVHGYESRLSRNPVIKYYVPVSSMYFWYYYMPKKIAKYFFGALVYVVLLALSSIPIIGPFLFHMLVSPVIAKVYVSKVLRLRGLDSIQRYEQMYDQMGKYTIFGLVAGMLDTIPIVSGFTLSSNTIAATLWANEQL